MYISEEQLKARLAGQNNLELRRREGIGKHAEIPREKKILAGVLASVDTQKNVAEALGTTQQTVSRIVNDDRLQTEIKSGSEIVREEVSTKAINILMKSLNVVEDKVTREGAKNAANIASRMASVFDKIRPRAATEGNNNAPKILINIHGSKQKSEEDYDVVDVEAVS